MRRSPLGRAPLFFCLAIQCLVEACKTDKAQRADTKWKNATVMEARAAIADPKTKDDLLIRLLGNVGPMDETPAFWKDIANNPAFSDLHRRRAVLQLFYRYVHPGMNLRELAEVMKGSTWLTDSDIVAVRLFSGSLPIRSTTGNIFAIGVLPTPGPTGGYNICFKMTEGVTRETISEAILKGPGRLNSTDAQSTILEIGYTDGYHGERE